MKNKIITPSVLIGFLAFHTLAFAQISSEMLFQVEGFSCTSPRHNEVDRFVKFIDEDMASFRKNTTKEMKPRYYGIMHTVWSSTDQCI